MLPQPNCSPGMWWFKSHNALGRALLPHWKTDERDRAGPFFLTVEVCHKKTYLFTALYLCKSIPALYNGAQVWAILQAQSYPGGWSDFWLHCIGYHLIQTTTIWIFYKSTGFNEAFTSQYEWQYVGFFVKTTHFLIHLLHTEVNKETKCQLKNCMQINKLH